MNLCTAPFNEEDDVLISSANIKDARLNFLRK